MNCQNCKEEGEVFLNLGKDLKTLGIDLPISQVYLCDECAVDYMNAFNRELAKPDRIDIMADVQNRIYFEFSRKTIESFVLDVWKDKMEYLIQSYEDIDKSNGSEDNLGFLVSTETAGALRILPGVTAKFLKEKILNADDKFPFDISTLSSFKLRQCIAMSEYVDFAMMDDKEFFEFFENKEKESTTDTAHH